MEKIEETYLSSKKPINNEEVDLKVYFKFILRNKILISSFTFIFLLIAIILCNFIKKTWKGEFQIVLNTKEEQSKVSGLTNLLPVQLNFNSINSLNTEVGILKSKSVLLPIYNFVKSEKSLGNEFLNFTDWKKSFLKITLEDNTSILNIAYIDKDKELILPVLNKITAAYQKYSGKSKRRNIELTKKYLNKQINLYKEKSSDSFQNAQEFAIDNNLKIVGFNDLATTPKMKEASALLNQDLENKTPFNLTNVGLESIRVNAANQIRNIDLQISKIEELGINAQGIEYIASIIPFISNSEIIKELNKTENKLLDLKSKYTDKDPIIQRSIEKKIALSELIRTRALGYLKAERITQESLMEASTRPKEILLKYKELIRTVKRDENTLFNLENELRNINLEDAKLEDPWELISNPTLYEYPVSPSRTKYAFLGSLFGILSSLMYAYILEKKSGTIYEENFLEDFLGIKIIEKINLNKKEFEFYSREIFINEIININSDKKINFITLGAIENSDYKSFTEIISDPQKSYLLVNSFNKISKNEKVYLLTSLGKFSLKELTALSKRIEKVDLKISGIIILKN